MLCKNTIKAMVFEESLSTISTEIFTANSKLKPGLLSRIETVLRNQMQEQQEAEGSQQKSLLK